MSLLSTPCYRWEHWGSGRFDNKPQVTWPISDGLELRSRSDFLQSLTLLTRHSDSHACQFLAVLNGIMSFSRNYVLRHIKKQKPSRCYWRATMCNCKGKKENGISKWYKNKDCLDFFLKVHLGLCKAKCFIVGPWHTWDYVMQVNSCKGSKDP